MGFHRLSVPGYFGGLPGGADYLNNATSGTPAQADGQKATGANAGTYFVGFAEDGTSGAWNRGLKALGENTDILDNWFHRDLAEPQVATGLNGLGVTTSIVLTGPAFVGVSGTTNDVTGIATFITLVDSSDNEIYNSGILCQVTAISGATPGGGFSTGNITLTVSPGIPIGVAYRVYYSTRMNLSTVPSDAFLKNRRTYHKYNGGPNWADTTSNPPTTITAQLDKILTDLSVSTGTAKIGGAAHAGSPYLLTAGTLDAQLTALLSQMNTEASTRSSADAAINTTLSTTVLPWIKNIPALNIMTRHYPNDGTLYRGAVYNRFLRKWHIFGDLHTTQRSGDLGHTWGAAEGLGVGTSNTVTGAYKADDGSVLLGATGNKLYLWTTAVGWTSVNLGAAITYWAVAHDPISNLWCAFGGDIGVLKIHTSANGTSWTSRTLSTNFGTPYHSNNVDIASNAAGRLIAAAADAGGTFIHIASSDDGGITWVDRAALAVSGVPDKLYLTYDSDTSTWILVTQKGSGPRVSEVWTSVNAGVSWTKVATFSNNLLVRVAPVGGLWLSIATDTVNNSEVVVSSNAGVTWYPTGIQVDSVPQGIFPGPLGAMIVCDTTVYHTARIGQSVNHFAAIG